MCIRLCELVSHTVSRFRVHHPFHTRSALAMGLHYVFHPSCSRHISPDRAEGRVSDMQWKGEVFCRLVGYAQKTYKIGINAAPFP
jgi:hypothetical protein